MQKKNVKYQNSFFAILNLLFYTNEPVRDGSSSQIRPWEAVLKIK
jgi:hypothetical protein